MTYEIMNNLLDVTVDTLGAELQSITGANGTEYLWSGNPAYWDGRATNLFPICGRLYGGSYTCNGKTYSMPLHGFARNMQFSVREHTKQKIVLEMSACNETRAIYPFDFNLKISYTLDGGRLVCVMRAENTGTDVLPFSLGGHPGFNVPLSAGLRFEDYYLEFDRACQPEKLVLSENHFATGCYEPYELEDGRRIRLEHSLFDHDGIFLTGTPGTVTLKSDLDNRAVRLTCRDMTHLGFWHASGTDAPFICIEPWHGLPALEGVTDDFATKAGMIRLPAGERYDFTYELEII